MSSTDRINNVCLVILAASACVTGLIWGRPVLVPFVVAVFIYIVASSATQWFQSRLHLPRTVALVATVACFVSSMAVAVFFVFNSLDGFLKGAGVYRDRIVQLATGTLEWVKTMGIDVHEEAMRSYVAELPVLSLAKNLTGGVMGLMSNSTLVAIFVIFLIAGERVGGSPSPLALEIRAQVSRYVTTKLSVSLATGMLVAAVLLLFGVELALMFAMLTFLLNFIPSIGSLIATALPVPVLLLQFGFDWRTFVILALTGALQFTIGNVIEPRLMGDSMDLHPITVLLFLVIWGMVWGIAGMFLAVPITAILRIVLARIETTRGVAELLAGRFGAAHSPKGA